MTLRHTLAAIAALGLFLACGLDARAEVKPQSGTIAYGVDPSGNIVSIKVDAQGNMIDSVGLSATTPLTEAPINFASSGDQAIVAAAASVSTKVYRLFMVCAGATTITFKDGSTALTGAMTLNGGGSITLDLSGVPWFTGTANTAFNINSSAAVQCSGRFYYVRS